MKRMDAVSYTTTACVVLWFTMAMMDIMCWIDATRADNKQRRSNTTNISVEILESSLHQQNQINKYIVYGTQKSRCLKQCYKYLITPINLFNLKNIYIYYKWWYREKKINCNWMSFIKIISKLVKAYHPLYASAKWNNYHILVNSMAAAAVSQSVNKNYIYNIS